VNAVEVESVKTCKPGVREPPDEESAFPAELKDGMSFLFRSVCLECGMQTFVFDVQSDDGNEEVGSDDDQEESVEPFGLVLELVLPKTPAVPGIFGVTEAFLDGEAPGVKGDDVVWRQVEVGKEQPGLFLPAVEDSDEPDVFRLVGGGHNVSVVPDDARGQG